VCRISTLQLFESGCKTKMSLLPKDREAAFANVFCRLIKQA
jgi:hypothetical protein